MNKLISVQYLRAFASVFVLFSHVLQHLGILLFGTFVAGAFGVDLFFIISGFLIYLTTKEGDSWKAFACKRFFRIYPLYWFTLILYLLFFFYQKENIITATEVVKNILMFPWLGALTTKSLIINVAWSTVYEVYFYFIFAIILILNLKKSSVIALLLFLLVGMKVVAYFNLFNLNASGFFNFVSSVAGRTHIIPFIIGILIAMFYDTEVFITFITKNLLFLKSIFIISNILYLVIVISTYNQFVSYFISTIIFLFWLNVDYFFTIDYKSKLSRFFSIIGDISFSLYLLHILIISFILDILKFENVFLVLLLSLFFSLLLSYFTYLFIEKPYIDRAKLIIKKFNL